MERRLTQDLPYRTERCGDLWVIEVRDGITLVDVERLMHEMTSAEVNYRLWYLPHAINLSPEHVRDLSMLANGQSFRSQVSAVVCPHDLTFGIGRMFESLAEADGRKVRVFRDQDEALAWLRSVREWNLSA